jgi:acyl carrier protein
MKNNQEYINEFIVSLIEKKGKLPNKYNIEDFDYIESGYIDSIGLIKFIVDIERKFDISISETDMEDPKFRTIGGLVKIIHHKL